MLDFFMGVFDMRGLVVVRFVIGMALVLCISSLVHAQKYVLVEAQDGSGIVGYKDTPIQPWSGFHVHDPDRPAPPIVTPAAPGSQDQAGTAPSDAIVLFDGTNLDAWRPNEWKIEDGHLIATRGPMETKEEFGDVQLHMEWMAPEEQTESIWDRGNNGVFFLRRIEVQIFDSYTTHIYPDGQAAAIYGQTPPLVNACRPPGQWQTFDIVFLAPRFSESGELTAPARITMFHNGILVHLNQEVYGNTPHLNSGQLRRSAVPRPAGAGRSPLPGAFPQHLGPAAIVGLKSVRIGK
jgi:hypothetical protein